MKDCIELRIMYRCSDLVQVALTVVGIAVFGTVWYRTWVFLPAALGGAVSALAYFLKWRQVRRRLSSGLRCVCWRA